MKIFFLSYFFLSTSCLLIGQTEYFNNRYPIQGRMGNTNFSIVVQDTSYFISPNNLKDLASIWENYLFEISLNGTDTSVTAKSQLDSLFAVNTGVIKTSNDDMVNAWALYDLDSFNYAIVFYSEEGIQMRLVVDDKMFAYLTPRDIQETQDHGFILTGIVRYLPDDQGGSQDVVLIRTDSLGNELWFKTLGGAGQQQGYSVAVCDDGGFIVAALDGKEVWIIRTDSMGTMLWERFYGSTVWGNAGPQRILQTRDGGYIFASGWGTDDFGINDWVYRPWIQKLDAQGDSLWSWFSNTNAYEGYESYITDIIQQNDGSFIAVGQEPTVNPIDSSLQYKKQGMILKLTSEGDSVWQHHYYHPQASNKDASHYLYRVRPTPDGGYVAAGYLALPDTGTQDSWVIKVDSNGCLTPNCLVTGLPQIRRQNHLEVTVYPNPTSGTIHLELPQRMAMYRIVVLSLNGKQLNAVNTTYQKNVTLQLDQPPGVYFVQVWEKDQLIFEEKVIVR
jgi:hypothetical protein